MTTILRYGAGLSLELKLSGESLVALCDAPRGNPLTCVAAAVDAALDKPWGFPPLSRAALPSDRVALTVEPGVPQAAAIIAQMIRRLVQTGVAAKDIVVVRAADDRQLALDDPLVTLDAETRHAVRVEIHDPHNRETLSYLAATANAKPIYINRAIHDADLVISIGCLRLEESLAYHGINSGLFPTFSGADSIERYRSAESSLTGRRARLQKEADEVAWLLGAQFTIQVVPGAGNDILHVLAGDSASVSREGAERCHAAWSYAVPRRADLVVASIEGDASWQSWENVARALANATRELNDEGAVVLCTQLAERPGPALQRIIGADNPDDALRWFEKNSSADTLIATEIVRVMQHSKVYLVSQLADELVEDLGMAPLTGDQVSRLARRFDSCLVLANAQHALALPCGEAVEEVFPKAKTRR